MANKVLTRVWEHSQQRGAARCLIVALADVADEHGIAYPGIPYLAGMINEEEDYTYKLLRKLIEAGEVLHKPGGGRGRKTLYAVVVGLSDAQRAKANTVLQSRVYHEKPSRNPALPSRVSPLNPGLQNTVLQNGVIEGNKPCTIPDSKQLMFDASGSSESPTDEKLILDHDPIGGGGGARARESPDPEPASADPLIALFARYDITQAEPLARLYHTKWPDVTVEQLARLCEHLSEPDAGSYAGARLYRKLKAGPYERQPSTDRARPGRTDRQPDATGATLPERGPVRTTLDY